MSTGMHVLRFINLLAAGLNGGGALLILVAVVPTIRRLPPSIGLRVHRAVNPRADRYLPITVALSALSGLGILILHDHLSATAVLFTILGLIGTVGVFVLGVFFDIPLSRTMHSWDHEAVPSEYERALARWTQIHGMRTAAALLAFVCYLLAGLSG